jgi:hypothetical protein
MNMKQFFVMLSLPGCFIYQSETFSQTPTSKVEWSSFNMGFAVPTSANTMVKSAVGQNFVGTMQQGNTRIESGFLADTLFQKPVAVSEKKEEVIPSTYELEQNYPNPFNPSTTIAFALPKPSEVTLKIFDASGREVATLVEGKLPAGRHEVVLDASPFSSGVYFYRLQAGEFSRTRRLMLVK